MLAGHGAVWQAAVLGAQEGSEDHSYKRSVT